MERVIGKIEGKAGGTLFLAIAQMHGNEPAGTKAMKAVLDLLRDKLAKSEDFEIHGKIVGLIGNIPASQAGVRFLAEDLNRMWIQERILQLKTPHYPAPNPEEQEMLALEAAIVQEIEAYHPEELFILDLHTTTAHGGTFSIPVVKHTSQRVAKSLHSPIIQGLSNSLRGTLMEYATTHNPWGIETSCVAFEAGQHESPQAVSHAISAIINALLELQIINQSPFSNKQQGENGENHPLNSKIVYRHRLREEDNFVMNPGYRNFMPIKRGEELARDKNGPIYAAYSGYILMPLYQKQGEDGFFIVVEE